MVKKYLTKEIRKEGDLTFYYRIEWSGLFGARYFIQIIKQVKNIPGFAPTHYDNDCGQLVMDFKNNHPYWYTGSSTIPNLELDEIKAIYHVLGEGFNKELHPDIDSLKEYLRGLQE